MFYVVSLLVLTLMYLIRTRYVRIVNINYNKKGKEIRMCLARLCCVMNTM